jgi:hypothetical protein
MIVGKAGAYLIETANICYHDVCFISSDNQAIYWLKLEASQFNFYNYFKILINNIFFRPIMPVSKSCKFVPASGQLFLSKIMTILKSLHERHSVIVKTSDWCVGKGIGMGLKWSALSLACRGFSQVSTEPIDRILFHSKPYPIYHKPFLLVTTLFHSPIQRQTPDMR